MVIACWSSKGGSGTTVVAIALAQLLCDRRREGVLLVDLGGDASAALGVAEPTGAGIGEWLGAGREVPADAFTRIEHRVQPGLALVGPGQQEIVDATRADVLTALLCSDRRTVVVDCGRLAGTSTPDAFLARAVVTAADLSLLVIRPCFLALRRAVGSDLRPSAVVLVQEPDRALDATDVEQTLQVPVVARVPYVPAIARAVDAGLLGSGLPTALARALRPAAA